MKTRILVIILLIALLISAGCKSSKNTQFTMNDPNTITADNFLDTLENWTSKLDSIAGKTKGNYNDWTSGKIKTDEFLNRNEQIRQEIKALNNVTDYKSFNLSENDKQRLDYEAIYKGYLKTSKDLNDFLESVPHTRNEEIAGKYKDLIENKYDIDISQLKKNLNM